MVVRLAGVDAFRGLKFPVNRKPQPLLGEPNVFKGAIVNPSEVELDTGSVLSVGRLPESNVRATLPSLPPCDSPRADSLSIPTPCGLYGSFLFNGLS